MTHYTLSFDGERLPIKRSSLRAGDDLPVTLGHVYAYHNGQERICFCRGYSSADWYVWSEKRQIRLATYRTRRELEAAWERSNNSDGPYGCAALSL